MMKMKKKQKKFLRRFGSGALGGILGILAVVVLLASLTGCRQEEEPVPRLQTDCEFYIEPGCAKAVVADGGVIEIQSGGGLDLQSGSSISTTGGSLGFNDSVIISGSLTVRQDIYGSETGYVFINDPTVVTGTITATSRLEVDGAANIDGAVTLNSTLDVDDAISSGGGDVRINDSVLVTGTITATSRLEVDSTANVDGAVTLNSTLDVEDAISSDGGDVRVNDPVLVTGTVTATRLYDSGALYVATTSQFVGDISNPGGSVDLNDNVLVTGTLTVRNDLYGSTLGYVFIDDPVIMTGTITSTGAYINGEMEVTGGANVHGAVSSSGGSLDINDSMIVSGSLTSRSELYGSETGYVFINDPTVVTGTITSTSSIVGAYGEGFSNPANNVIRLTAGAGSFSFTQNAAYMAGHLVYLDADNDTFLASTVDDEIRVQINGTDRYSLTQTYLYLDGHTVAWDKDQDTVMSTVENDDEITLTLGAATGFFDISTGNLKVGNAAPNLALNGEDVFIEGTLEVDGVVDIDDNVVVTGSISATGSLNYSMGVISATANTDLQTYQSGALFVANGVGVFGGGISATLPSAAVGLNYCFYLRATQMFTIAPGAADQILLATNALGDRLTSVANAGNSVCLVAIDSSSWVTMTQEGLWTDTN